MNTSSTTHPQLLQVFGTDPHQARDLLVYWADGRLRDMETGMPVQLQAGATGVICQMFPPQRFKQGA